MSARFLRGRCLPTSVIYRSIRFISFSFFTTFMDIAMLTFLLKLLRLADGIDHAPYIDACDNCSTDIQGPLSCLTQPLEPICPLEHCQELRVDHILRSHQGRDVNDRHNSQDHIGNG